MGNLGHPRLGALRPGLTALPFGRHRMVTLETLPSGWKLGDQQVLPWGTSYAVGEKVTPAGRHAKILKDLVLLDGQESQQTATGWVWVRIYETLTAKLAQETADVIDFELNGLQRLTRPLIGLPAAPHAAYVVGTSTLGTAPVLYLAGLHVVVDDKAKRAAPVYLEAGIVDADTTLDADAGIRYVTFQSVGIKYVPTCLKSGSALTDEPTVAFQGGEDAQIVRDRIGNVKGLRTYNVTVMMKADGSALAADGSDNVVATWQDWALYSKPGEVTVSSGGINAYPGNSRPLKVLIEEVLSTNGSVPDENKPFSVKSWAGVNAGYTPADGSAPGIISKGADGYLAESVYVADSGDFAGIPITSVAAVATSDPTPAAFYALNNQVIDSRNGPSFITDAGVRWYRRRRVTVVGTFGTYLDA